MGMLIDAIFAMNRGGLRRRKFWIQPKPQNRKQTLRREMKRISALISRHVSKRGMWRFLLADVLLPDGGDRGRYCNRRPISPRRHLSNTEVSSVVFPREGTVEPKVVLTV